MMKINNVFFFGPTRFRLQKSWPQGIPCKLGSDECMLHPAPFPCSMAAKKKAAVIIREVARLADLVNAGG